MCMLHSLLQTFTVDAAGAGPNNNNNHHSKHSSGKGISYSQITPTSGLESSCTMLTRLACPAVRPEASKRWHNLWLARFRDV